MEAVRMLGDVAVHLSGAEVSLVAAATVWCGSAWGFSHLAVLLFCSCLCTVLYPEPSEYCRRQASIGLVLGTSVLPTLFAAGINSVETLAAAFRLTWWAGLTAAALRTW